MDLRIEHVLAMATGQLPDRTRINCVLPGTADTPWIGRLMFAAEDPAAELAALEARQPCGGLDTTGVALSVDGGFARLRPRPR